MSRFSFALNDAPPPAVALEIGSRRVAAAAIERRGGQAVIGAHAVETLPEGALVPSLTAPNVLDRTLVAGAIGRVLERVGRPRRVGLVIPDPVAKISLVRFEQVPARAQDLGQLIRWQVRKAAPFALDDAQISYVDAGLVTGGREFIVTLARRDIVEEYEALLAAHGAHAGIVDISTFNVINAVLAGAASHGGEPRPERSREITSGDPSTSSGSSRAPSRDDWLLVNVAPDWASIAILRGPQLVFFRTRSADADGTLADLVHQTSMYYEDRLEGAGLTHAVLCGASHAGGDDARRSLEERLALPIETVDVQAAVTLTDRITAAPALLDTLAPLTGLLLRAGERVA